MTAPSLPQIPFEEPDEVIQGDSWIWTIRDRTYPANLGWTLTYYFAGASVFTIPTTTDVDGVSFDINYPPLLTALVKPGSYTYRGRFSNATLGASFTSRQGTVEVLPDLSLVLPGALQPYAETLLPLVEAEIKARISGDGSSHNAYSAQGNSISKLTLEELYKVRARCLSEIQRAANGGGLLPAVTIRFALPGRLSSIADEGDQRFWDNS